MQSTELSRGSITCGHEFAVLLQERPDNPPIVLIEWPDQATICTPHQLQAVAAKGGDTKIKQRDR
jgi:hypothetical protein